MKTLLTVVALACVAAGPETRPAPNPSAVQSPPRLSAPETLGEKVARTKAVLDAAKQSSRKILENSTEYKEAVAEVEAREAELSAARAAGSSQATLDASAASNKARFKLATLKNKDTPEVASARRAFNEAQNELVRDAIAAQQRAQDDARRRQALFEASPIFQAIIKHQIIRGMTYDQAKAAMEGPPSGMIDAGRIRNYSWEWGSRHWSATFEDGIVTVVSVF